MKKLISTVTAVTFILALTLATQAATEVECEVMASKENAVVMNCGDQATTMDVGTKITLQAPVNTKKKAMVIEGC
ncbi:MAG: hypothetical protein KKD73_14195 [Proteobacteria bacterium]|nr:hypothetical protein [Pseudomonadota bacterium]MBU1639374.1 hypothetical protein [Pseudomonadota bacterium]